MKKKKEDVIKTKRIEKSYFITQKFINILNRSGKKTKSKKLYYKLAQLFKSKNGSENIESNFLYNFVHKKSNKKK